MPERNLELTAVIAIQLLRWETETDYRERMRCCKPNIDTNRFMFKRDDSPRYAMTPSPDLWINNNKEPVVCWHLADSNKPLNLSRILATRNSILNGVYQQDAPVVVNRYGFVISGAEQLVSIICADHIARNRQCRSPQTQDSVVPLKARMVVVLGYPSAYNFTI